VVEVGVHSLNLVVLLKVEDLRTKVRITKMPIKDLMRDFDRGGVVFGIFACHRGPSDSIRILHKRIGTKACNFYFGTFNSLSP
jgi:hypothetical protein